MTTLPLIFDRKASLPSWLIRAQAWGGPSSHCGVVDGHRVIESLFLARGVVPTPLSAAKDRSSRYIKLDVWCPDPEAGLARARSLLAEPGKRPKVKYDHKAIFGVALRNDRLQDDNRIHCGELCLQALQHAGLDLSDRLMRGVSPTQLYWSCIASNAAAWALGERWELAA